MSPAEISGSNARVENFEPNIAFRIAGIWPVANGVRIAVLVKISELKLLMVGAIRYRTQEILVNQGAKRSHWQPESARWSIII